MSLRTRTIPLHSVLQPDSNYGDITIGRASSQARGARVASPANLFLPDRTVSKKHAIIEVAREHGEIVLSVMDTESHHGTVVHDSLLSPGHWVGVDKGDLIGLVNVFKEKRDKKLFSEPAAPSEVPTESCKFSVRYEGCEDGNLTFTVLSKDEVASLRATKQMRDVKNVDTSVLLFSDDDDDYVLEDRSTPISESSSFSAPGSASHSVPPFEDEEGNCSLFGEEEEEEEEESHDSISISIDAGPETIVFDDDIEVNVEENSGDVILIDQEDEGEEHESSQVALSTLSDEDDANANYIDEAVELAQESFEASQENSTSFDEDEAPNTPEDEAKTTVLDAAPVFKLCSLDSLLNEPELVQLKEVGNLDKSFLSTIKLSGRSKSNGLSQEESSDSAVPSEADAVVPRCTTKNGSKVKAAPSKIGKVKSAKKPHKSAKKEILTGLVGFAVGMTMGAGLTFSTLASLGKSMGA